MLLTPSYLTTNQSEEFPQADQALFLEHYKTLHYPPPPQLKPHPQALQQPRLTIRLSFLQTGRPSQPRPSHDPDLSELGSSLLLLHAAVRHEVVKHFSCRAEASGSGGAWWGWRRREQGGEGRGLTSTCIFHHQVQCLLRLNHLEELHCSGQGVVVEGLGEKRPLSLHLHSVTAHVLTTTPLTQEQSMAPY